MFFELAPDKALLGDNNPELIEVYKVVRDSPAHLYKRLCAIPRDSDSYYRWRAKTPAQLDLETRALRFIYLNRNCFNGIYRTNFLGRFNVPMGTRTGAYFTKTELLHCSDLLKKAEFIADDFSVTISQAKRGDFVYLDPPFAVASHRVFRQYARTSFNRPDIPRLCEGLAQMASKSVDFLVSYADCIEANTLAEGWNSIRIPIRRFVAGFADHRERSFERLITNMPLPSELASLNFD